MKNLPLSLSPSQLEQCQADVVGFADRFDPDELRKIAERMVELIDPEHAEALEADRAERDARIAFLRRSLVVVSDHHGSMLVRGQLPMADGQLFLAQLDALMPSAASYHRTREVPDRPARRADALVRWCAITAASGKLPALDVGRAHRFFTRAIRAALVLRDQGCAFPGCDARRRRARRTTITTISRGGRAAILPSPTR